MVTFLLTALLAGHAALPASAIPSAASLRGRITSDAGVPVAGARVVVMEARRETVTDDDGHYYFGGLPNGTYAISFAAIGYLPTLRTVTLRDTAIALDVVLTASLVEVAGIQVTATPLASSPLRSSQPVTVMSADELAERQAVSLGATVEGLPGVRAFSTGTGIGKPVIRGLTGNRVLVLDDGQRVESQDWGEEHGPQVETSDAARIEVIRGPASVLYGSDALGGVVNVVARAMPEALDRSPFVAGSASLGFATNGRQPEAALMLEAARGALGLRATASGVRSGDVSTPAGDLFNSGTRATNGALAAGYTGTFGSVHAGYSHRGERIEIHEDPALAPLATPLQRIGDDRLHLGASFAMGGSHLDIASGWQRNDRREFETEADTEAALRLRSTTWTAEGRLHHPSVGPLGGVIGLSGLRTTLVKSGRESLVPSHAYDYVGAFVVEQGDIGRWSLGAGLRLDHRALSVEADTALGVMAQQRTYGSVTGSLGVLYRLTGSTALALNLGRGFRAPTAFELFANGVHEGTVRFERGDSTLRTETSFNADLAVRVQTSRVNGEITVFRNAIDDYIYPDPTRLTDSASGFRVFDYRQGDAALWGLEAVADVHAAAWLHLEGGLDFVRGQNLTLEQPLPWIPPQRATYRVRFEAQGRGLLRRPYIAVGGETNARQTRLDPEDYAPPGHSLVDVAAGSSVAVGPRSVAVVFQLRNALDTRYTNFMSRYKRYAFAPGRTFIVRLRTAF